MEYETLNEEFEETFDEMMNVAIEDGDEVLYADSNDEAHVGKVVAIERYSDKYTPPTYFYEIQKEDGTIEGFESEYVVKRKTGNECNCGSGLQREEIKDGYGIFLTFACPKCKQEKMSQFRPDIFTQYDTDECIDYDY